MIYITGDTHRDIDFSKLNTRNFPEQKTMDPAKDFVIILGDFGGIWDGSAGDDYILKTFYNNRNFTTLFVDGNHENHDLLDKYPFQEWNGGKVHMISDRVIHLMRGQVYNIQGITFFTMGGAESTDKFWRKEGISWWALEMPSDDEYEEALKNLEKVDFDVDVVLTHCAPEGYIGKNIDPELGTGFGKYIVNKFAESCNGTQNRLTEFMDDLITDKGLKFKHWYYGHYHLDWDWEKFSFMYNGVKELHI